MRLGLGSVTPSMKSVAGVSQVGHFTVQMHVMHNMLDSGQQAHMRTACNDCVRPLSVMSIVVPIVYNCVSQIINNKPACSHEDYSGSVT